MADENKGIAMAILGIVAVIAVAGVIIMFNGATANVVASGQKIYGGALKGEEFPYLTDRTTGGFPPAVYYPAGVYTEDPGLQLQEDAGFYGETIAGERLTSNRQPYYVPSGQICAAGDSAPGFRCPQGTTCIEDHQYAESGSWIPAPEYPCFVRADSSR